MNKDSSTIDKVETPAWMKWGLNEGYTIQTDELLQKQSKEKAEDYPLKETPKSTTPTTGHSGKASAEKEISEPKLDSAFLRAEKKWIQAEYDSYKEKTAQEMKEKDDLISALTGDKKKSEALEIDFENLKNTSSKEVMDLVEMCLDLVDSNDYLEAELAKGRGENEDIQEAKRLKQEKNYSGWKKSHADRLNLSTESEPHEEYFIGFSPIKVPSDKESFKPNKPTALFSSATDKADMLFGTCEKKSYAGRDKSMSDPGKLQKMFKRGSATPSPFKFGFPSPSTVNSPASILPWMSITKTPDSCDAMNSSYEDFSVIAMKTEKPKNMLGCLFPWKFCNN